MAFHQPQKSDMFPQLFGLPAKTDSFVKMMKLSKIE